MSKRAEFEAKRNRFNSAFDGGTPDIVPVFSMVDTYVLAQAHYTIEEAWVKDKNKCVAAFKNYNDQVYSDMVWGTGNTTPFKMLESFGNSLYCITGETVQTKGSAGAVMKDDEYPLLIENPREFLYDTIIPRKYEVCNGDEATLTPIFRKATSGLFDWVIHESLSIRGIEKKVGLPVAVNAYNFLAPDFILDFLRDFVGISKDIRRRPDELYAACEAVYPMIMELTEISGKPNKNKVVHIPLHLPTYMRPKDFEKLYLPWMIRAINDLNAKGYRLMFFCERDWTAYADMLKELPKGPNGYIFECGDLKLLRESIRGKGCFMGGMRTELLKYGTKEECIDEAKRCLEDFAPGGGYIFTTDKFLLCGDDTKIENLAAVNEYVHTHGKY